MLGVGVIVSLSAVGRRCRALGGVRHEKPSRQGSDIFLFRACYSFKSYRIG
jgi:hypothetical protein